MEVNNIYLQAIDNPIWTVSEVGAIHLILLMVFGFLIYNLFDSIAEIVSDFKKWFKQKEK